MNSLAVIPARGGSKRLPRKNILDFCGRPIIAHTIESALNSDLFSKVVVSTEDDEIARHGQRYGAEVLMRPDFLASDTARVVDVCLQVLKEEESQGRSYDVMCCLYATEYKRAS